MLPPGSSLGYDRSSTMYNPDGRIIQTEYAREAMRRGSISVAIRSKEGVVLAGRVRASDLDLPNSKISQIDDHFAAIFAGFAADGRVLISRARIEAQVHKMTYGASADIKYVATRLADYAHMFTQQGGLRPLGVGLLLGGIETDGTPRIYFVNPGGGLLETRAKAIGHGDGVAMSYLKEHYREDMTLDEVIQLAKDTIKQTEGDQTVGDKEIKELSDEDIEVWSISVDAELPKFDDII